MIRNELPYSKEEYYVGAQGNPELNIDITENGDYDVRKYATAKVNVSGGGDYPIITATWHDDTEKYTYSCNWSFTELKAKLEEQTESRMWVGIYMEESYDGAMGGTWGIENASTLTLQMSDQTRYDYRDDGTIVVEP